MSFETREFRPLSRCGFGEGRGAEGTPTRRNGHLAEAFWTFLGGRIGCRLTTPHSGEKRVHGQHYKKVYGGGDQHLNQRIYEVTDGKLASIDRKFNRRKNLACRQWRR